jgi:hypothetical protein
MSGGGIFLIALFAFGVIATIYNVVANKKKKKDKPAGVD